MSINELRYHEQVCNVLVDGVRNRDWFLWVEIEPPPGGADDTWSESSPPRADTWPVSQVEAWLARLDPTTWRAQLPEMRWSHPHGPPSIKLRAIPKQSDARGTHPLIANPVPASSYSGPRARR